MIKNLELTNGLIFSQKILLELAKKGLKRQKAYEMVQKSAMKTFNEKIPFEKTVLENDELMQHFEEDEVKSLFNYNNLFNNADYIFKRCGLINS